MAEVSKYFWQEKPIAYAFAVIVLFFGSALTVNMFFHDGEGTKEGSVKFGGAEITFKFGGKPKDIDTSLVKQELQITAPEIRFADTKLNIRVRDAISIPKSEKPKSALDQINGYWNVVGTVPSLTTVEFEKDQRVYFRNIKQSSGNRYFGLYIFNIENERENYLYSGYLSTSDPSDLSFVPKKSGKYNITIVANENAPELFEKTGAYHFVFSTNFAALPQGVATGG